MLFLSLGTAALAGNPNTQLRNLASSYKGAEGFEVVDIGGVGLRLLRLAARTSVESKEDREALKLFSGLKRLTIVDFSEASAPMRDQFLGKANRILSGSEMLLEMKDGGETVRIYGVSSADGSLLEDIALLAEDTLIFIRGSIRTDQIEALMRQADR